MPGTMPTEEVARRGQELYDRTIRARVEPDNTGRFLVVDVLTGDFEIADTILSASDQARARNPNAVLFAVRIGSPALYRIGPLARIPAQ